MKQSINMNAGQLCDLKLIADIQMTRLLKQIHYIVFCYFEKCCTLLAAHQSKVTGSPRKRLT